MSILLYRVDERLIHGQVVVGWGSRLDPDRYVVVDDALADSAWEQELYHLGVPEGAEASFVCVAEARRSLAAWRESERRIVILTRNVTTMLELARGRRLEGEQVNVGGIHHAPGREKVLDYLYLNETDRQGLRGLEAEGVAVSARDLPDARRVGLARLLA